MQRRNGSEIEAKDTFTIIDYFPHSVKKREHKVKRTSEAAKTKQLMYLYTTIRKRDSKSENGVEGGTYSG